MARHLVIVESPAKARTLQRFLGEDWVVRATAGHVKDLPPGRLAIDRTGSYEPEYQVLRGKGQVLQELAREARLAETVYLATDPDREGEAIAWHVAEELGLEGRALRAKIHEITPAGIERALREAGGLDRQAYEAQQARRIVDRIVGFSLAPLLSRAIDRGLSAGRVQSLALRLVVERDQQRRTFSGPSTFVVEATCATSKGRTFLAGAEVPTREEAEAIAAALAGGPGEAGKGPPALQVGRVEVRERTRMPPPPFVTARLQQEAFSRLGFSLQKTMRLAQRLYEGVDLGPAGPVSLVTYARTDSPRVSETAAAAARRWLEGRYGAKSLPDAPPRYPAPATAQDAHEAIRPTAVELEPELVKPHLDRDAGRLYELIWKRFCASQLGPARYRDTRVEIEAGGHRLRARGLALEAPGFLVVWGGKTIGLQAGEGPEAADLATVQRLPELHEGEGLAVREVAIREVPALPPEHHTEATLLAELESRGIGRPSTWSQVVDTLVERGYVQRQRGRIAATELGEAVVGLLLEAVPELVDPSLTSRLEAQLEEVASGARDWVEVVRGFHLPLEERIERAKERFGGGRKRGMTETPCERCGAPMALRWGRSGPFLSCSTYPACRHTRDLAVPGEATSIVLGATGRDGVPSGPGDTVVAGADPAPPPPLLEPPRHGSCPRCGSPLVERRGRAGPFLACSAYPACRTSLPLSTGVRCPACGEGELVEKRSRRGSLFFGCNRWPACSHAMRERPVPAPCPRCGAALLVQRFSRREGGILACVAEGCSHWQPLPLPGRGPE